MILNHRRESASKDYEGDSNCPDCAGTLIAKCGEIKIHHWAHATSPPNCEYQPKTEWHMGWQLKFPLDWLEVKYTNGRADVMLPKGDLVEFQSKGLDSETLKRRTEGTKPGAIAWVVDGREAFKEERLYLTKGLKEFNDNHPSPFFFSFRWIHSPNWFYQHVGILLVDIGNDKLLDIRHLYKGPPVRGWGQVHTHDDFLALCKRDESLNFVYSRVMVHP
ncbi:MAG: competence protein CoiA family protein [Verrucomicrobiota bacterium]